MFFLYFCLEVFGIRADYDGCKAIPCVFKGQVQLLQFVYVSWSFYARCEDESVVVVLGSV